MPNTKAQGTILYAESARAATKPISAVTNANPAVVTATAHGYSNGQVVFITGLVGPTQLNDRAFVISGVAANTFTLGGEDSTTYGAYVSGGTAAALTMQNVGQVSDITAFDGKSSEVDITHLLSAAKQWQPGLPDFGNVTLQLITDNVTPDTGQALLRSIKNQQKIVGFQIQTVDGKNAVFTAGVMSFTADLKKDSVLMSQVALRVSNQPQWFA
ncbi:MAG TPA: phage tail tube protein [Steroidobacteraceae bacterium]|jgi:hypothetical protein